MVGYYVGVVVVVEMLMLFSVLLLDLVGLVF